MAQSKKIVITFALVILMGVLGYAGDSAISKAQDWFTELFASSSIENEDPSETVINYSKEVPKKELSYPKNNQATNFPKAATVSRPNKPSDQTFTPPANPYAAMNSGINNQKNLQNTLQSITPGEARPRSNAYFDKLSQQLRELQGENPPEPGAAPNPTSNSESEDTDKTEEAVPERSLEEVDDDTNYGDDTVEQLEEVIEDEELVDELEEILIEEGY